MSIAATVHCNGHRASRPCGSSVTASIGYGPTDDALEVLVPVVARLRSSDGWRHLPSGSDLCPSTDHDEDPS